MKSAKILVVEDEKVVATDIEESLEKLGYTVVGGAATGIHAIRKVVETEPDLVLMDIKLKGKMDGVDAASELHERFGIPIVFLTAYADGEILERAKRTSPSGYVLKPFDERALRSAVEIALHRHPQERRLIESERRLVSALRSIDEGVIIVQDGGFVTLMNRAAERLTGWEQTKAVGRPLQDVFSTVGAASGRLKPNPVARVLREGVGIGLGDQRVLLGRHGTETWIRGSVVPLHDQGGTIVGAALVFRAAADAEREDAPARARDQVASRLETAGRVAGGISARVSQALEDIESGSTRLLANHPADGPARVDLERLAGSARQARRLAERLAEFTVRRPPRVRVLQLNRLVEDAEPLLECLAGNNIQVILSMSEITAKVVADSRHLEEVLLRIAAISCDSMPDGGKLTVETSDIELLGEYARAQTILEAGDYAVVTINHTGSEAPATGRGLRERIPDAYELITLMGGDILVRAEPGSRTSYEVYLPRAV